jgi:hypothetical protein
MKLNEHKMKWFVYAGDKKIRREATMRGSWGYDVECSCGWTTRTGGATLSAIRHEIWLHKILTRNAKVSA